MTNCICGIPFGEVGVVIAIFITAISFLWVGYNIGKQK